MGGAGGDKGNKGTSEKKDVRRCLRACAGVVSAHGGRILAFMDGCVCASVNS